jgi:hypothetical protein
MVMLLVLASGPSESEFDLVTFPSSTPYSRWIRALVAAAHRQGRCERVESPRRLLADPRLAQSQTPCGNAACSRAACVPVSAAGG